MADTQILIPGSVFSAETSTTAVQIAMGAGGLMALQNTTNVARLTFNSAHGYAATTGTNGVTTFANSSTGHGPTAANLTYFQLNGATGTTSVNGVTFAILGIPSTTTMDVWCTISGTNPTVTSANFWPVFCLTAGQYNITTGANGVVQYNPDNTGYPQVAPNTTVTGATFRTLLAASTNGQIYFDGVGQTFIICNNGSAGTTRWSALPK